MSKLTLLIIRVATLLCKFATEWTFGFGWGSFNKLREHDLMMLIRVEFWLISFSGGIWAWVGRSWVVVSAVLPGMIHVVEYVIYDYRPCTLYLISRNLSKKSIYWWN
jgi:hypothetical protein